MKVYLSSSWKNRDRVRALALRLRGAGHEVYDFTDPACRKAPEIPPEKYPEQFDPSVHVYREYITSVPEWRAAVEGNRAALDACDAVVLMLPCGNDSHADWAYAVGAGKWTLVAGQPRAGERSTTHLWGNAICDTDEEVPDQLKDRGSVEPRSV